MTHRRKSGSRWEKIPPKRKKREPACKPGSVEGNHSSRTYVAARLKQPTRRRTRAAPCPLRGVPPYLVLLQVGFAVPLLLPAPRCALTAPFHPYHACLATAFGGLLSVALSVGLRPPGVTWHLALWSPDFPLPQHPRMHSSDCLVSSRQAYWDSSSGSTKTYTIARSSTNKH